MRSKHSTLHPASVRSEIVPIKVSTYPGQGFLEVHVYFKGVEVTATVTIIDSQTGQEIGTYVTPEGFPVTLDTGNYLLYAYYEEYKASQTVEVKEGQTAIWRVYMEPKRICFVATACYGYGNPNLETFRLFRDNFLLKNFLGRKFVYLYYYVIGEPIASLLKSHKIIRKTVKTLLDVTRKIARKITH